MKEKYRNLGFGDFIFKRRKELGLSQKLLAEILNKKQSAISQYQHEVHFPTEIHEYLDLANVLEVSIIELMETVNYSKSIDIKNKYPYPIDLEEYENIKSMNHVKLYLKGKEITDDEVKGIIDVINQKRNTESEIKN